MKKLLIAVLLVAVMAVPAFASVQNVKVSGDLQTTWAVRDTFDFTDTGDQVNQNLNDVISYARVRIDADLTDNVSTTVRLLNERAWGDDTSGSANADVELDLAYVQLREMLYSPLTVTLGRQELFYGNGFIIGGNGPNNNTYTGSPLAENGLRDLSMRNSLDAVKAVLNYDPLTIDMFAAVVDSNDTVLQAEKNDDVNLYGINANYKFSDKWNTIAEGYFFSKYDHKADGEKKDTIYVPGMRLSTNPIKGLNLQGELAWQRGNQSPLVGTRGEREAVAGQFIAGYLLPFEKTAKYQPVVSYAFTYASGDDNYASGEVKGWDPMYEHLSGGKIYNAILNFTNVSCHELALSVKPVEDITLKGSWSMLYMNEDLNTTLNISSPMGASAYPANGKKDLGDEIDLDLTYAYTEDVSIGMSAGWFFPGEAFERNGDRTATQLLTSLSVAF